MQRHLANSAMRALVCLALLVALAPAPAALAAGPEEVDESRLVPTLSSSFAPWDCKAKLTGPVCTGERHLSDDWAPIPDVCDVPIWGSRVEHRYQTRYYDHDYLNYYREFRTNDVDYLSTSPTGPATASISTNVRFFETFGILGDDQTLTITTKGVLWDLRPAQGPAIFRAVGTLVEPYNAAPTFSGQVTIEGESTRYDDEPLETFLTDEFFVEVLCQAATAGDSRESSRSHRLS